MYTLGIPNSQYRRATQVLGSNNADPIEYSALDQNDGFYLFSFDIDYDNFNDIVFLLKNNGITTIGADDQLTERNIMKLTDLIKEQPGSKNDPDYINRMETAEDVIEMVDEIITDNPDTALDLLSDMVEDFYENQSIDRPDTSMQEQKLKKLIKILVKEWHEQN
tara:strand:- start:3044 stop:3535 length:492 start_codon:yes stop_codon:yes gene_type:complete